MKRIHLIAGLVVVATFLLTGQYLRHCFPSKESLRELTDGVRLLFRSRHIYILCAGLLNLALGLYFENRTARWRRAVQFAGSALLLVAPVLLFAAFVVEPARSDLDTPLSHFGLYALFGGTMLHAVSGIRGRTTPPDTAA